MRAVAYQNYYMSVQGIHISVSRCNAEILGDREAEAHFAEFHFLFPGAAVQSLFF